MRCRRAGRTLVEVMVATALFGLVSLILVYCMTTSGRAGRKSTAGSDAQRACLAALGRLQNELRGVRLTIPAPGDTGATLSFDRPQVGPDGNVVMTALGTPAFEPTPVGVELTPEGLLKTVETEPKILGRLFSEGAVSFTRIGTQILEIDLRAQQSDELSEDRRSRARIVTRIALTNS